MVEVVRVSDIICDESLYPRLKTYWLTVYKYAKRMEMGERFPPIVLGRFGGKLYLIDGWHRLLAASRYLKRDTIEAEIRDYSSRKEMLIDSIRLNLKHGLPLSVSALRVLAKRLHDEYGMSLREISLLLNVPVPVLEKDFIPYAGLKAPIKEMLERQHIVEAPPEIVKNVNQDKIVQRRFQDALDQLIELLKLPVELLPLDDPSVREKCAYLLSLLEGVLSRVER